MQNKFEVIRLLEKKKNVLLMGAPGTGKSKLMNDVAQVFLFGGERIAEPAHVLGAKVPIPALSTPHGIESPLLSKANRKVFRTTLHQNSKYRDFLTGILPSFGSNEGYQITSGILYRANEFAKQADSAALLIIDEINRGPAIEVFGGSIVAIESDKRLSSDNTVLPTTQFFEILSPENGQMREYAFSPNLFMLAAMNQADASVAPIDVAFMRRWQSYKLTPNYSILFETFCVAIDAPVPDKIVISADAFSVAIHALIRINEQIAVGRGEEYQIGQGVFLSTKPSSDNKDAALEFLCEAWSMIYAHIEELFFGDSISIASVINAESTLSPYFLEEAYFAGETKYIIKHGRIGIDNIFDLYRAAAGIES